MGYPIHVSFMFYSYIISQITVPVFRERSLSQFKFQCFPDVKNLQLRIDPRQSIMKQKSRHFVRLFVIRQKLYYYHVTIRHNLKECGRIIQILNI